MRELATIRRIKAVDPIPGADKIEVATVDGWKVVVPRGAFRRFDLCVYFEIDSFLRDGVSAWQFLVDKSSRMFEGEKGHVLRTVTLQKQLSQGLVLSMSDVWGLLPDGAYVDGMDVTELLGVKKWEPEIPAEIAGQVKGAFPSFIRKTDQERCQNLEHEIFVENAGARYEVTTKLDGTSCTIYWYNGELGVCGRNWELKVNDENAHNALIRAAFDNLFNISLARIGRNVALQGEVIGPGIQKNREQLKKAQFHIFDIFDIDRGEQMPPAERMAFIDDLMTTWPLVLHVPVMYENVSLEELGIDTIDALLEFADGPSLNNMVREGLVFKRLDGGFSFKAIANSYLLRHKE